MTSFLRSKTKEDYGSESVLVEQGGENLVLSLGNILNSAAQKASVIERTAETSEIRSKVNTSFHFFLSILCWMRPIADWFVGSFPVSLFVLLGVFVSLFIHLDSFHPFVHPSVHFLFHLTLHSHLLLHFAFFSFSRCMCLFNTRSDT